MTAVNDRARFEGDDLDEYLDLDDEDALDAYRELAPGRKSERDVAGLFDDDDDDDEDGSDGDGDAMSNDPYDWEDDLDRD